MASYWRTDTGLHPLAPPPPLSTQCHHGQLRPICNMTAMNAMPVAWITIANAMSDRPQAQSSSMTASLDFHDPLQGNPSMSAPRRRDSVAGRRESPSQVILLTDVFLLRG